MSGSKRRRQASSSQLAWLLALARAGSVRTKFDQASRTQLSNTVVHSSNTHFGLYFIQRPSQGRCILIYLERPWHPGSIQEAPRNTQEEPRRPGTSWSQNVSYHMFLRTKVIGASSFACTGAKSRADNTQDRRYTARAPYSRA